MQQATPFPSARAGRSMCVTFKEFFSVSSHYHFPRLVHFIHRSVPTMRAATVYFLPFSLNLRSSFSHHCFSPNVPITPGSLILMPPPPPYFSLVTSTPFSCCSEGSSHPQFGELPPKFRCRIPEQCSSLLFPFHPPPHHSRRRLFSKILHPPPVVSSLPLQDSDVLCSRNPHNLPIF